MVLFFLGIISKSFNHIAIVLRRPIKMKKLGGLKGNVLVVGNSGVGKSTLINAVLGEYHAETGWGIDGRTKEIKTYENNTVPFRLIDTAGFEPSPIKLAKLVHAIKKFSKERASDGNSDTDINVIWFCVDGTAAKLFKETIENFLKATSVWKSVPIIVAITKSYSSLDRDKNVEMVNSAFKAVKHNKRFPTLIAPVVAEPFYITEDAFAAPYGISELVTATNNLLPEGIKAAEQDVADIILSRKRIWANSVIASATAAAATVGAIPIPFPDGVILTTLETALIKGISSIYEIPKGESHTKMLNTIVELGTVGAIAKAAITAIKAIPGLQIAASVLNAAVAGSMVMGIGEGCKYIFEQIYLGKKSIEDLDWIKQIMESAVASKIVDFVNQAASKLNNPENKDSVRKVLFDLLEQVFKSTSQDAKQG